MKTLSCLTLFALSAACTGVAAETYFTATLTNAGESHLVVPTLTNGQPRPASFGFFNFTLNDAMTELTFTGTITNIDVTGTQTLDTNDNLVAAHIHAPATTGSNASVRWGFIGAPFNDTNPTDTIFSPFATGVGGTFTSKWDAAEGNFTTLTAQLPNLNAGLAYLNFHTVQYGAGEIRGSILPTQPVPDAAPSALLLCASLASLFGVRGLARRRGMN